jgi:hypothetical protein
MQVHWSCSWMSPQCQSATKVLNFCTFKTQFFPYYALYQDISYSSPSPFKVSKYCHWNHTYTAHTHNLRIQRWPCYFTNIMNLVNSEHWLYMNIRHENLVNVRYSLCFPTVTIKWKSSWNQFWAFNFWSQANLDNYLQILVPFKVYKYDQEINLMFIAYNPTSLIGNTHIR